MLCCLELGDGVVDFIGLDEELKQSRDSTSVKQIVQSVQVVTKYDWYIINSTFYVAKRNQ